MKRFLVLITMMSTLQLGAVMANADSDGYYDPNIYDNNGNVIGYIDENGREVYDNGFVYDGEVDDPYGYEEYYGYDVAYSAKGWDISQEGYVVNADFSQVATNNGRKYKIVVPQSVDGHKVVGLADEWLMLEYEDMPNVEIYIPSTISFIAEDALHNGPVALPNEHPMYFYESGSFAEKFFNNYNKEITSSAMDSSMKFRTATVGAVEKIDITDGGTNADTSTGRAQSGNVIIPIQNDKTTADDNGIKVNLNGISLNFTQPPVIENGTTLVPMRAIFEAMGASVEWNNDTKTVTSKKGNITVVLTLDKDTAMVNDKEISLAVPAKLVNGNTMVPLRFVSESMGAEVNWDGESKTVTINSK